MAITLCTTIVRDGLVRDVTIEFTAECTSPGCARSWDDPVGADAEYAITFERAELVCPEPDDHDLTEVEMATLRTWLVTNDTQAFEAANDNFADDPGFDDRGFRGLEA